jgi:5-formyltetrahydrofolate cyclo-ligase
VAGKVAAGVVSKTALRKQVVAARDAIPTATRRELSERITTQILGLQTYRSARCVLAYMSFGSEFDTSDFIANALAHGKTLCLPRVVPDQRRLNVHTVENLECHLQSGVWGIREPRADRPLVDLGQVDIVLLPGVAFTPRCERLGYGGGFYDRLLPRFERRPHLVAAAFGLQIRDQIPLEATDQCIDVVISESGLYLNC